MSLPFAIVAVAAIAAVTVLSAMHVDASIILGLLGALGLGGVLAGVQQVRENTNGNMSKVLDMYHEMATKNQAVPPAPEEGSKE